MYLVGAGPGDPGLLTVRAAALMARAEVVLHDALVGPGILALIPDGAEVVDVGKRSGDHTVPQGELNERLVARAREGKCVVRLKGGDPFVFGRGGEEAEALAAAGIDFEVVPGVTSAVAAPAYAGIPVTHRDMASAFQVVTGHAAAPGEGGAGLGRGGARAGDQGGPHVRGTDDVRGRGACGGGHGGDDARGGHPGGDHGAAGGVGFDVGRRG